MLEKDQDIRDLQIEVEPLDDKVFGSHSMSWNELYDYAYNLWCENGLLREKIEDLKNMEEDYE